MNPEIIEFLKEFEGKVYFVGGFVRDVLLANNFKLPENLEKLLTATEKTFKDTDITIDGDLESFLNEFKKRFKNRIVTLKEDIGEYRIILGPESWIDLNSIKGKNILEDLEKRDFTINSMAVDIKNPGVLIDPLNGLKDLKKGLIRSHTASNIQADPLRILRGFRFVSRLCFESIKRLWTGL